MEIEAPVQITDEYVRNYLWEHNLVAIDEGDLRLVIPELMKRAGWVRKKEWQGLTNEERMAIWTKQFNSGDCEPMRLVSRAITMAEAKLKEKNSA